MKKYLIFTLKKYIPLFVVSFAVCFFSFITVFGESIPVSTTYVRVIETGEVYQASSGILDVVTMPSGLMFLIVPVAIFTMILPFFANSYRYSLQSVDTFYQIGKNKKMIRWVNNLLLLTAFIVIFTLSYLFAVTILMCRQLPNVGRPDRLIFANEYEEQYEHFITYNYGYYVPAYFLIVVFAILNYAISYFLITRSNNLVDSIMMLIFGEFILGVGVMTPFWFVLLCNAIGGGKIDFINELLLTGTRTACFISPIAFILYLFNGLITGSGSELINQVNNSVFDDATTLGFAVSIVSIVLFVLIAGFGIFIFLKEKESSGELAGKPVGRDAFQTIIFHTAFGLIGLYIGGLQSLVGASASIITNNVFSFLLLFTEMGFYGAAYYVLFGLLRRNFKLNKKELPIMLGVFGANLIIGVSLLIAAVINLNLTVY